MGGWAANNYMERLDVRTNHSFTSTALGSTSARGTWSVHRKTLRLHFTDAPQPDRTLYMYGQHKDSPVLMTEPARSLDWEHDASAQNTGSGLLLHQRLWGYIFTIQRPAADTLSDHSTIEFFGDTLCCIRDYKKNGTVTATVGAWRTMDFADNGFLQIRENLASPGWTYTYRLVSVDVDVMSFAYNDRGTQTFRSLIRVPFVRKSTPLTAGTYLRVQPDSANQPAFQKEIITFGKSGRFLRNADNKTGSGNWYANASGDYIMMKDRNEKTFRTFDVKQVNDQVIGLKTTGAGGKASWAYYQREGANVELPALIPYRINDKWGYCDASKKMIVPASYDNAKPFVRGLAKVELNHRYGLLDTQGKTVVAPRYALLGDFREGLSAVCLKGKYGYIDTTGKLVIPCMYDCADAFSNGKARVCKNDKAGYIDRTGKLVSPFATETDGDDEELGPEVVPNGDSITLVSGYVEGLAVAVYKGQYGYVNRSGEVVIPFKYSHAEPFRNGIAEVCIVKPGFVIVPGKMVNDVFVTQAIPMNTGYIDAKGTEYWEYH